MPNAPLRSSALPHPASGLLACVLRPLRPALLLALACCLLAAQQDSGTRSVAGHVLDPAGRNVAGAVVQIKDTKSFQVRSFITQEDGGYHFFGLSTSTDYEISASKDEEKSPVKALSSFDSRTKIVLDLRLKAKSK